MMKKQSLFCLGLCLLVILSVFSLGCIQNDDNNKKNVPPIVQINVKDKVYSNTTFCFNVYIKDPDGNISNARIQWDFDNNGVYDWDSKNLDYTLSIENGYYKQYHSYESPGEYTAILKVTDNHEKSSTEQCRITVIPYSLSIEASLNKKAYLLDESILLTVTIKNNGIMPINVSEMDFFLPTLGKSKINTPDRYIIQSMIYFSRLPFGVTVDGNSFYSDSFDLLEYTFGIWDGQNWTEYNLTKRGKYSIEVIYSSSSNCESWNGNMKTEPITFALI